MGTTGAKPGDMVTLWTTGLGDTNPPVDAAAIITALTPTSNPVTVWLNGTALPAANVLYAGMVPGLMAGVYQVNIKIPTGVTAGDAGNSVRVTTINRVLDTFVQQQLRTETSGGAYADLKSSFYQQLMQIYGQPGSDSTFDSEFNNFTSAVQALATTPNSTTTQGQVINAAQVLAQRLNSRFR